MIEHDIARLIDLIKSLWPGMQWTDDIRALFVERVRRLDITYEQARAKLHELKMTEARNVRTPHPGVLYRALEKLDPAHVAAETTVAATGARSSDDNPRTWPRWRVWAAQMRLASDTDPREAIAQYALAEAARHEQFYGADPRWPQTYRAAYTYAWEVYHQGFQRDPDVAIAEARSQFGRVPDYVFADGVLAPRQMPTQTQTQDQPTQRTQHVSAPVPTSGDTP